MGGLKATPAVFRKTRMFLDINIQQLVAVMVLQLMMVPALVPRLMPLLMLHLLLAGVPPVAAAPYDPFDVSFDASSFRWINASQQQRETQRETQREQSNSTRPLASGSAVRTILLNLPASRRLTFLFNASSESPCTFAKKGVRVVDDSVDDTLETNRRRTVYLGPFDDLGSLRIAATEGTRYRVLAFALVRVQSAASAHSSAQCESRGSSPLACVCVDDIHPALWAISGGLEVHSGIF